MTNTLPEPVNKKRRKALTRYSALALLVYHIPIGNAYLAKYLGLANYEYRPISIVYLSFFISSLIVIAIIQMRGQITVRFINVMLYTQVVTSLFHTTAIFYVMSDLRFLAMTACLLVLIFVFVQAKLSISFMLVFILTLDYLGVSYIGTAWMGQVGRFGTDVLVVLIFLPVSLFLAYMCSILQKQRHEIKQSRDKIQSTYIELENFNQRMLESLHYAEMIQRSLLPGIDRMKTENPDSLIIWIPKDIVGGDIFFTCTLQNATILAVIDCTGHGVPGAFLTMIAYTEIRKIILEDSCHDPAGILGRLNRAMKTVLYKNSNEQTADDGLDAAVVNINHKDKVIRYAGAQIPLFYIQKGELVTIKGDRHSLGYKKSDEHYVFKNHTVKTDGDVCLYLKTDGFTDQLGGHRRLRFSRKRFEHMLLAHHQKPFGVQREEMLRELIEYKGDVNQMDDITLIGMRV